jgi:hypothetical protein
VYRRGNKLGILVITQRAIGAITGFTITINLAIIQIPVSLRTARTIIAVSTKIINEVIAIIIIIILGSNLLGRLDY